MLESVNTHFFSRWVDIVYQVAPISVEFHVIPWNVLNPQEDLAVNYPSLDSIVGWLESHWNSHKCLGCATLVDFFIKQLAV